MDKEKALDWIDQESEKVLEDLLAWACINSWSLNIEGLLKMEEMLKKTFSPLADKTEIIPLVPWERRDEHGKIYSTPLGNALLFVKRVPKLLLGGHMDTVFSPSSPFQVTRTTDQLVGPGVADMKGGLLVLWLALSAFERYRGSCSLGWKVLINPDEEIGSPGSEKEWKKHARNVQAGLLFEPAYPDGAFVDRRKGSHTATVLFKGSPAHVGRDFDRGKSAVKALSSWMEEAFGLAKKYPQATLNIAGLTSSSLINIIPEEAKCTYNLRSFKEEEIEGFKKDLEKISSKIEKREKVNIVLFTEGEKPPKLWNEKTAFLFDQFKACARKLNLPFAMRPSGGLCDGNFIAEMNVPCIDTLGVIGGGLHTQKEYMQIKSLAERAKLTCLFLFEYAEQNR